MTKKVLVILASVGILATGVGVGAALRSTSPDCSLAANAYLPACVNGPRSVSVG